MAAPAAAYAQEVVATIPLGAASGCQEVAVDEAGNRIYASDGSIPGSVKVIDGASDALSASVPAGTSPWGIAFNPATGKVYAANQNGGGVTVIDATTNTVVATVESGRRFSGVAVDSSTNKIYASEENSSSLWIIDGATDTPTAGSPIDVGVSRPALMVLNPDSDKLYIGNNSASPLQVLDTTTNTVVASIPVGLGNHMALDLVNGRLYLAQVFAQEIEVIDLATDTIVNTIPVPALGGDPLIGVGYNPNTNHIFVSRALSHSVVVLDAATFAQTKVIAAPSGSFGFAVNTATNKVYVCERGAIVDGDPPLDSRLHVIQDTFPFAGFFRPVDNPPVLNAVKAGQAIPVKFSLDGDRGLAIFAENYPKSQETGCDTGEVDGIESTVTAGSSSLSYAATSDQYTYVWKTSKDWAGTCRQLVVKLTDGSSHRANFKFK